MAASKTGNKRKHEANDPSYGTSGSLPKNVSSWNLQHLTSIGIAYAKKGFPSPLNLLDSVPFICKDISEECETFINYLAECIDFTITTNKQGIIFDESREDHLTRRREYRSDVARKMVETIDQNLNKLKLNYFKFEKAASLVSRENTPLIYAAAFHFILRVRELIMRTFNGENIYEQFFTDMMLKFGEIFCLISNSGGSKRRFFRVGDIMVTSVPDIRYSLIDLKDLPFQTETVVSIVEVKRMGNIDCNYGNRPETRSCCSLKSSDDLSTTVGPSSVSVDLPESDRDSTSSFSRTFQLSPKTTTSTVSTSADPSAVTPVASLVSGSHSSILSDFNINTLDAEVLGQHGGELLAEYETVVTRPYVVGMIVHGTKIIVTCLKLEEEDYDEIKHNGKLPEEQSVSISYSRPFDLFFPEDRKILYRVFFRLSDKCCSNSSTKLTKNPAVDTQH
ncbi:Hypothetical predicted protein [Mytilus galloprovincialis]|uniref:Uncharacterized protein n=1 Tax=Mytilus galloprovincialis TaxID=29158 RepID=A0A8B6DIK5_MYTGA|nr:Hypothetical predicted protein [Mytilus galloprovincialis]